MQGGNVRFCRASEHMFRGGEKRRRAPESWGSGGEYLLAAVLSFWERV